MKIAFFTEAQYNGYVPRTNTNMRTDQAWICALKAMHYNVMQIPSDEYDIGIVIIPKEQNRKALAEQNYPLVSNLRTKCKLVFVMQEGTHWDWMEDSVNTMCWFYNQLMESDVLLCHNDIDARYYSGITSKPCHVLPTLMIEDNLFIIHEKDDCVFVAGNWHQTYRGFDAWIIGREFELPMYAFKAGKYRTGEQEVTGMTYLPWIDWTKFMSELSKCKYGIQTYETSAGQFPLNCAYLGIPCIGYNQVDTQRLLHPELSVEVGDVYSARLLANKLKNDREMYEACSSQCMQLYNEMYTETKFLEKFNKIIEQCKK